MLPENVIDQIDRTYPEDLFRQLGYCRDSGFTNAIEIAVNTGMDSCHRNREGYDAQQRRSAAFQEKSHGDGIGVQIDTKSAAYRQSHSHQETCHESTEGSVVVVRACFTGNIFRNRSLHTRYGQGKRECENWRNQLIDAHAFSAESIREEDTVKKADKATEQSGQRQNNSSGYKGIFPVPFHNTPSLRSDMLLVYAREEERRTGGEQFLWQRKE